MTDDLNNPGVTAPFRLLDDRRARPGRRHGAKADTSAGATAGAGVCRGRRRSGRMPAMSSTERIYLRMERPGFPCDIAGINVLEPSPEGALPFEAVRAIFAQRRHRSPLLTRDARAGPAWHRRGPVDTGLDAGPRRACAPQDGPRARGHGCPAGHGLGGVEGPAGPQPPALGGVVSDRAGRRRGSVGVAHAPRGHRRHGDHAAASGSSSTPSPRQ